MNRLTVLLACAACALALTARAQLASASGCKGSSDDDGGSSSSGGSSGGGGGSSWSDGDDSYDYDSDDDDYDDGSESAAAVYVPSCDDTSVLHGRAGCRRFASYAAARPRLQIALGTTGYRIASVELDASGTAEHASHVDYHIDGAGMPPTRISARTFDVRLTGAIGRHAYAGGQASIGALSLDGPRTTTIGPQTLRLEDGLYATVGALAGAGFSSRWLNLRAELEIGREFMNIGTTSFYGDCVVETSSHQRSWYTRPRITAETWITPWISAGASLSSNLTRKGELSGGFHLAFHTRGFDSNL